MGKSEFGKARDFDGKKSYKSKRGIIGARSEEEDPTVHVYAIATAHSQSPERHVGHLKRHVHFCDFKSYNAPAQQYQTSTTSMATCDMFNASFASFSIDSPTPNVVMMIRVRHS